MKLESELQKRSLNSCELCKASHNLNIYTLQPSKGVNLTDSIYACNTCVSQLEDSNIIDPNHWRCSY